MIGSFSFYLACVIVRVSKEYCIECTTAMCTGFFL